MTSFIQMKITNFLTYSIENTGEYWWNLAFRGPFTLWNRPRWKVADESLRVSRQFSQLEAWDIQPWEDSR